MFNFGYHFFNTFVCDIFFMINTIDVASYADDKTPYSLGKKQCGVGTKLQKASVKLFKWFHGKGYES